MVRSYDKNIIKKRSYDKYCRGEHKVQMAQSRPEIMSTSMRELDREGDREFEA